MDVRFNNLPALHWLWFVAAAAALLIIAGILNRKALARFATTNLLPRLTVHSSPAKRMVRAVLLIFTMVLIVAALIDPRWGVTYRPVQQRGADILILLDVSKSMLAEDARPNRLERAKQYIRDLVSQLAGDRVGLITFAGIPSVRCPLTVDYGAFLLALDLVDAQDAPRGGSLLGDAFRLCSESFTDEAQDYKAVILFTDGEDHGSYPQEAAQRLHAKYNTPIITVGIGDSEEGARIPINVNGQRVYLTYQNQEVWSKMDPALLRELALATNGAYVPAGTGYTDMAAIYRQRIEPLARRDIDAVSSTYHHAQYQWFAGAALLLLIIEMVIGDRKLAPRPAVQRKRRTASVPDEVAMEATV